MAACPTCSSGSSSRLARVGSWHTRSFSRSGDTKRPDLVGRIGEEQTCVAIMVGRCAKKSCGERQEMGVVIK